MAESGHKIKGIGAPFDTNYSSCSNIKPTNFNWCVDSASIVVHIDRGLFLQPDKSISKTNRFGWVCESTLIVPDVYNFLTNNYNILFETYYNKIFTCDHSLIELHDNFVYCPNGSNYPWVPKLEWKIYNKTKLCNMFCSPKLRTKDHYYRHDIAKLAIDLGFDVFGGAHNTQRTVVDPMNPWSTKSQGLKDYRFSVVMENGIYDSYWTEKLTDCFATGTIPIYWGTSSLPKEINQNGIIRLEAGKEKQILESLTAELYDSMSQAVNDNFNFVNTLKTADDYLFDLIKG